VLEHLNQELGDVNRLKAARSSDFGSCWEIGEASVTFGSWEFLEESPE